MAEEEGKKEEKFDFTSAGEELGYISLDQAVLQARQQAQEDGERYRVRLGWDEIVWSEISSEEREDTFRIVLQFRRPGRGISESQTGEEEFFFDHAGALVFRQSLAWPEGGAPQEEPSSPITKLDQAVLQARQQAQEDGERYRVRLGWDEIVWSEISSEEREDTFRIVLQFRRPGLEVREDQTGEEEFVFDHAGALVFRQVLAWPESGEPQEEPSSPIPMSPVDDEDVVQSPSNKVGIRPGGTAEHNTISFIRAIKLGFQGYFNFTGRSTRAEFWWWTLFVFIVQIVAAIVDVISGTGVFTVLFYLAVLIPGLAVGVRRLHDINKSGWWLLLILLWWLIIPAIVLLFWSIRPSSD
jgi:hypothetical protein